MTKVLMLSIDRRIFEEGSEVRSRMARFSALAEELHVVVFTRGASRDKQTLTENVTIYPTNSFSKLFALRDAIYIGRTIISDGDWIVSAQDPFEVGFAAWRIVRGTSSRLQLQIHTDFLSPYFKRHSFKNRVRTLLARFLLPKADCIRVVSKRVKDSLGDLGIGDYESKTAVLPLYTDAREFERKKKFELRTKYPQFTFIILMVSRLEGEKNINLAIAILKEVVKEYPRTGLVVVGDGRERSHLQRKVKQQGLEKQVVFEGWKSDLLSYYKSAHVFLSTSLYEGYGKTLIEAALSGCPIVSSDVGIAGDVLKDEEHVLVCPVADTKCFVSKVSRFIEENQLRLLLSERAKEKASEHLDSSWDVYLTRYKEALETCSKEQQVARR